MEESNRSLRGVRFGVFEVDLRSGELRKQGLKIKLQGQPIQILGLLLERPGELVTREELREKLWPTDTFVDFEHGLNAAVKKLRAALGDSADNPRFVETLHRRGYRFIAPVETPGQAVAEPRARLRPVWIAALALVALAAGVIGLNVGGLRDRLLGWPQPGEISSIAVLPLKNLSGDPEQDYFADGMTEALITELGKISALRVISRQSVMRYKSTEKSVPEIARELNVAALVEGSVLRDGDRVRVAAQLVGAVPERHLWADSFERDWTNVLALQQEVARAIASQIRITLTPEEETRLARARTVNPEAYELYLKGRYFLSAATPEAFQRALEYFRQAIDMDPTYAPAHAGLADSYNRFAIYGHQPPMEAYPIARAAALRALELDDTLAEAHTLLGVVMFRFEWEWESAERELKRALQLEPSSSRAHLGYGTYLFVTDRYEEGLAEFERRQELDPLGRASNMRLAVALYRNHRYDDAIVRLRKTLELAPDSAYAYTLLGNNYAAKKMYPEAIAACQKAQQLMPEDQVVLSRCGSVYSLSGRQPAALAALQRLISLQAQRYVDPFRVASLVAAIYTDPGQRSRVFEWLERAYEKRSANLCFLGISPAFPDSLRSDPRFQSLLRRLNFPE